MNRSAPTPSAATAPQDLPLSAVVQRLGSDVAMPLTTALDRLHHVVQQGHLGRDDLLQLRQDIASARRAGLLSQQIARLAAGQAQQTPETLDLAAVLRQVLDDQSAERARPGQPGHRVDVPTTAVMADAGLLALMLRGAADWAQTHAGAPARWQVAPSDDAGRVLLSCEVPRATDPPDPPSLLPGGGAQPPMVRSDNAGRHLELDTLDWLLLQCAAHLGQVRVDRSDGPAHSLLRLHLPRGHDDSLLAARPATLMAGSQVLALVAGRPLRQRVRQALQGQEVFVDCVSTVAEARAYCDEGLPQALVFESGFAGAALEDLCSWLLAQRPSLALVALLPDDDSVSSGQVGRHLVQQVGQDALRTLLAPTLTRQLNPPR